MSAKWHANPSNVRCNQDARMRQTTDKKTDRQTTHATEKYVAIGGIACSAKSNSALQCLKRLHTKHTVSWRNYLAGAVCSRRCRWWATRSRWSRHRRTSSVEPHHQLTSHSSQPAGPSVHRPRHIPLPTMIASGTATTVRAGETAVLLPTTRDLILPQICASFAWTLKTNTLLCIGRRFVDDFVKFNRATA